MLDHDPTTHPVPSSTPRVEAYAIVARHIYREEHAGVLVNGVVFRITNDARLRSALARRRFAVARAQAAKPVLRHEVRVRITRGPRVIVDVGLPFVVAGAQLDLKTGGGRLLGRVEVSIQDVVGFVRLVHRLTGAQVVVRGRAGRVESSFARANRVVLPPGGNVTLAGRRYAVASFSETGFAGEPLRVWLLIPSGA